MPKPRLKLRPGSGLLAFARRLTLFWGAIFELVLLVGIYLALYGHWPNDQIDPSIHGSVAWFSEIFYLPSWYVLVAIGALLAFFWYMVRIWPFTLKLNLATARPWQRVFWLILTTERVTKTERRILITWGIISLLFVVLFPLAMTRFLVQLAVQLLAIAETAVLFFGIWQFILRSLRWARRNPQQLVNVPLSAILKFLVNNRSRP